MDEDWLEDDSAARAGPSTRTHAGGAADPLTDREYDRLKERYTDAGYREGITSGKLSTLQQGFDESFALSVGASRRLGNLRGRAGAMLAILSSSSSTSTSSSTRTFTTETTPAALSALRDLVADLSRVRRTDVLPPDLEREAHEREHGEEDMAVLRQTDARDMDDVEGALAALGGAKGPAAGGKREEELLDELEARLEDIVQRAGLARPAPLA